MSDQRLRDLKAALTDGLGIDLIDPKTKKELEPAEIAKIAEMFCTLSHKPGEFYGKAKKQAEASETYIEELESPRYLLKKVEKELLIKKKRSDVKEEDAQKYIVKLEGPNYVLTPEEKEILIKEKLEVARKLAAEAQAERDADDAQEKVGHVLAEAWEHGDATLKLPRDQSKARKYGRVDRLINNTQPDYLKSARAKKSGLGTSNIYLTLGWFTSFRLFFVRSSRILNYFNYGFLVDRKIDATSNFANGLNAVSRHLEKIAWYASLSYAAELVFDFGVLFRTVFKPTLEEKKNNPSAWSRFINTLKKDDRMPRMVNAAVWFGINFACWYIAPQLAAILNLALFTFDLGPDIYRYYRDKAKHDRLLIQVTTKIKTLEKELENAPVGPLVIQQKIAKLAQVKARLEQAKKTAMAARKRAIFVTSMILVGMFLLLIPQFASPLVLTVLAATVAVAAAAILGNVIYSYYWRDKPRLDNSLNQVTEKINTLKRDFDLASTPMDRLTIQQKIEQLQQAKAELEQEKKKAIAARNQAIFIALVILGGMIALTVPQIAAAAVVSVLAVKIVAASIAMLGSIIGGLGNRIRLKLTTKAPKPEVSQLEYNRLLNEQYAFQGGSNTPVPSSALKQQAIAMTNSTRAALIKRFRELNPRLTFEELAETVDISKSQQKPVVSALKSAPMYPQIASRPLHETYRPSLA